MTKTKIIEKYDGNGKLIERIVETEHEQEVVSPSYVPVPCTPWPNPPVITWGPPTIVCQQGQNTAVSQAIERATAFPAVNVFQ